MKEISKWEVVWSQDRPFIVYRSRPVFKVFKVKVEDDFFITAPIEGKNNKKTYEKIRKTLCEKYDLDEMACDVIRELYRECYDLGAFGIPKKSQK